MNDASIIIEGQWCDGVSSALTIATLLVRHNGICTVENHLSAPLRALKISDRLGDTPRRLVFPDGSSFSTSDNDSVDRIVKQHIRVNASIVTQLEQSWRLAISALFIIAILSFGFLFYGVPYGAYVVAMQIPDSAQQRIGQDVITVLDKTMLSPSQLNATEQQRLQGVFRRLLRSTQRNEITPLLFRRLEKNDANAFALPDGSVVITDGLLALAKNDAEIEAVLAHELGHLEQRHTLRTVLQQSGIGLLILSIAGDASNLAPVVASLPTILLTARYSREFELEADVYAAQVLRQQGAPKSAFTSMLSRLNSASTESSATPALLLSHPVTEDRITAFNEAWDAGTSD